eukprot:gi/632948243/ref/XP_007889483.1/ PREDICTED: P2Y purinoceptor 8-like [Callorhinchus milii]
MINRSTLLNSTLEMLTDKTMLYGLPTIYLLVFIISTPLNIISLWLFCCRMRPKTPTVIFLINLAVTDLLYSLTLPFQVGYHLSGNNWQVGSVLCSLVTLLFYGNLHCSVLTITLISVERYLGIVHPLRFSHLCTNRMAGFLCLLTWLFVLICNCPFIYTDLTIYIQDLNITTCFDVLPKSMFPGMVYFCLYFAMQIMLFFLFPFITMTLCYCSIIRTLLRSPPQHVRASHKHVVRLTVLVLLVFTVCYLPTQVILIIHMVKANWGGSIYVVYKLSLTLNTLNGCFDPLLYYFASKEFRRHVQRSFSCFPVNNYNGTSSHMVELVNPRVTT